MNKRASSHEQLLLSQAEQARVAVEYLFKSHAASDDQADVQISFKRRRPSQTAEPTANYDEAEGASDARSPKVFRIEKRHEPEGQQGCRPSVVDPLEQVLANVDTSPSLKASQGRGRRGRRLHGDVKIIHPTTAEVRVPAVETEALELARAPASRPPSAAYARFGNDIRLLKRYEHVMSKIARLEQQVKEQRNRERFEALRWIEKAMQDHDIDVLDLAKA